MIKIWMTPTPNEAARDTTNAIHSIVLRLAKYLPEFGFELVEEPGQAELRVTHAGQGSTEPADVAIYHGLYPTGMGMDGVYFAINSHVIRNLRTAKAIIAPSEWIADVLRRDMHVQPHIVSWGVDVEEWTPGDQPHVYALWNKARVDYVSDPAPMLELASRAPHVPFLTTFGEGGPNVKTIGRQPYEVMKNHVRNAGVYLSTNVETFGLGILEACASGVPILGFRQGAIAEYLTHGWDSFLAEPGDMDGLVAGLEYVFQNRPALSHNARLTAQRFTWREMARKTAAVFNQVLQPHVGPKVSVVIPCHNYEQYVGEAIESTYGQQTNFDYEIIVVLDRCTDNSAAVVQKMQDLFTHPANAAYNPRFNFRALTVDNGSLSTTRNDGIAAAQGEYVVLLDADDRLGNEQFLQVLSNALDADRTLGIAFTSIRVMDAEGNLRPTVHDWPNGYDFDQQAARRNQVPSCCMFRKEAWKRAGGFRPWFKYAEDAEFWLGVGAIGYGAKHVVKDGWFHYRLHNNSASKVHRTGEIPEPDWTEFYPWTKDNLRPFAADGKAKLGSWPVRFYNNPDVSVIIPVGPGHEETVKDTLHSLEGQTHRFWECIVVNDTGGVLELNGFPWAKVICTNGTHGAGAARNLGAAQAQAPFLVFLDSDDILKPRFLALALQAYRRNGRYAYSDWMTDDRAGKVEVHTTPNYSVDAFRNNPSIHPVTALIPRQWFAAVGGFDESLDAYEDVDFYLKMLTHGYCGVRIPEPLLVYNLDAGQRRAGAVKQKDKFLALLKNRYREFMERNQMCDCVDPPKGLAPAAPTIENAAAYHATYGDMVKVQYISPFAPESPITLRGPATRVNYGARAKNDIFHIWQADLENSEGMFEKVDDYMPPVQQTIVPAPPTVDEFATEPAETEVPPSALIYDSNAAPSVEAIKAESFGYPVAVEENPRDYWYSADGEHWQNDARPGETLDSDPLANLRGQYLLDDEDNVKAQARSLGDIAVDDPYGLADMTRKQLIAFAKENEIDLGSANTAEKVRKIIQAEVKSWA